MYKRFMLPHVNHPLMAFCLREVLGYLFLKPSFSATCDIVRVSQRVGLGGGVFSAVSIPMVLQSLGGLTSIVPTGLSRFLS